MSTTNAEQRWNTDGKWASLSGSQKIAFFGKLVIAILTMGFAFPNILND